MGIVNLTPDSFSDGGRHLGVAAALAHARRLWEEGADILDLGAESTRPGARELPVQEELDRLLPALAAIRAEIPLPISVDTRKAAVMRAAHAHGATLINDVSALTFDPEALDTVTELELDV
jgi:dihydropteroate synthase